VNKDEYKSVTVKKTPGNIHAKYGGSHLTATPPTFAFYWSLKLSGLRS